MVGLALSALGLSAFPLALLCLFDPKRRRVAGAGPAMMLRHRRSLVATATLPGLGCLLLGNTAAFTLWLGGVALLGWGLAAIASLAQQLPACDKGGRAR